MPHVREAATAVERPFKMTVTAQGIDVDYGTSGYFTPADSQEAVEILTEVLPPLPSLFLTKNRKYMAVTEGYDLGAKGVIPEVNRKLGVLYARLWKGVPPVGESTEEVVQDMVGHLLIMLRKLKKEEDNGR